MATAGWHSVAGSFRRIQLKGETDGTEGSLKSLSIHLLDLTIGLWVVVNTRKHLGRGAQLS